MKDTVELRSKGEPPSCSDLSDCDTAKKKRKVRQVMEKPIPVSAHPGVFLLVLLLLSFTPHHAGVQLITEPRLDFNHPYVM